jgi:hypothetical protein
MPMLLPFLYCQKNLKNIWLIAALIAEHSLPITCPSLGKAGKVWA